MSPRRRSRVPHFEVLSAAFCALLCGIPAAAEPPLEPVRIGAIVSLTGPAREQGQNWLNGAELARRELAAEGLNVELIVENDQTSAPQAVAAFRALHDLRKVRGVLGGTWDFLAEPLYPLAERARVPFLTMTNPIEILPTSANSARYVFTNAFSMRAAKVALRDLFRDRRPRKLAILTPAFAFALAYEQIVRELGDEFGIPIVFAEQPSYEDVSASLKTMVTRIGRSGADTLSVFFGYEYLEQLTHELALQHVDVELVTSQHLDAAWKIARNRQPFAKAFGVYPFVKDSDFTRRYREAYGEPPPVYAAEGYDGLKLLARAAVDGIDLGAPSRGFEHRGVIGTYRFPTESREIGSAEAVIMTTMDGTFAPYRFRVANSPGEETPAQPRPE